MSEKVCANVLGSQVCIREVTHPGACRSKSGHWWAKYSSGRTDVKPFQPVESETHGVSARREVWK